MRDATSERGFSGIRLAPVHKPLLAAGCGGAAMTASQANSVFSVAPGPSTIDTNCTGCNAANRRAAAVHQFKAMLNNGGAADVSWSVSGGDLTSGAGKINASAQYAPPVYLTADRVQVQVDGGPQVRSHHPRNSLC